MSDPFLAEVRVFPYGFVPRGWMPCNGQIMAINQNQALFSLLGTTYGGNGTTTFALPDMRGRVPVHFGNGIALGQLSGEETHALTSQEMPMHNHLAMADSNPATTEKSPVNNLWAAQAANAYGTALTGTMNSTALAPAGSSQSHDNMQPYLALQHCIAIMGIYPSRN